MIDIVKSCEGCIREIKSRLDAKDARILELEERITEKNRDMSKMWVFICEKCIHEGEDGDCTREYSCLNFDFEYWELKDVGLMKTKDNQIAEYEKVLTEFVEAIDIDEWVQDKAREVLERYNKEK